MIETIQPRARQPDRGIDQAAGLRELFARPGARLLPVLAGGAGRGETPWLARLGEAFARTGQKTLLIDASRAQIAAVFGLRARFDLQHALDGDCRLADVQLDAASGLTVVPAARACERAVAAEVGAPALLSPLLAAHPNIVLLLLPATGARLVAEGDVLVPVLPTRDSVAAAVAQIGAAASSRGTLTFCLLFLGMDKEAAATLGTRMSDLIGPRLRAALRFGAVAPLPRDLGQAVAAVSGLTLAQVALPAPQVRSGERR